MLSFSVVAIASNFPFTFFQCHTPSCSSVCSRTAIYAGLPLGRIAQLERVFCADAIFPDGFFKIWPCHTFIMHDVLHWFPVSQRRGLQTFSAEGHIDDFLRLGGPNVQKNSIHPKYGEWQRFYSQVVMLNNGNKQIFDNWISNNVNFWLKALLKFNLGVQITYEWSFTLH